jgi:hypothetical protein
VVALVDDHDVEILLVDISNVGAMQALNRCEYMLEPRRAVAANPLLAETRVSQRIPKRSSALIDDLLTMRDEEKSTPSNLRSEARVIDRRHNRLASAGGSDKQVAMVAVVTGEDDLLEQRLLEWGAARARSGSAT